MTRELVIKSNLGCHSRTNHATSPSCWLLVLELLRDRCHTLLWKHQPFGINPGALLNPKQHYTNTLSSRASIDVTLTSKKSRHAACSPISTRTRRLIDSQGCASRIFAIVTSSSLGQTEALQDKSVKPCRRGKGVDELNGHIVASQIARKGRFPSQRV